MSSKDESVLREVCRMWINAMKNVGDDGFDMDTLNEIGDRLVNSPAKSFETLLYKFEAAQAAANQILDENHPVKVILNSAFDDYQALNDLPAGDKSAAHLN